MVKAANGIRLSGKIFVVLPIEKIIHPADDFFAETSHLRYRGIWRETVLIFQLLRNAIVPATATLRSQVRQWAQVVLRLSERSRQGMHRLD